MQIIPIHKVAQIILFAHELGRAEGELRGFLETLDEDERHSLVALMWIGRGAFEPEEYEDALMTARQEASSPTADYLIGSPHFADHLEAGVEAMGLMSEEDEDANV